MFQILKKSFDTGEIPRQLKTAKIIPLFKSGDKTQLDNYRPIALLNMFSKILEKIVCIRLTMYIENNNFLSKDQFGFRRDHSTLHPVIHFLNKITDSFEKKQHTMAIFCDLQKAFDSCNHAVLLGKLERLGVGGVELLWFKNYLCNCEQFVSINKASSSLKIIENGVPQGSTLGPILFLLYINDLPNCSDF